VEADEDTDVKVGGDTRTSPDASGVVKSRRKTKMMAAKQSVSTATAEVSMVKAAERGRGRPVLCQRLRHQ
jgi:hypothetical protein